MALKRIWIAISRRKMQTLQLVGMFFFVGLLVSLIIGVISAGEKMETRLRDEGRVAVSITMDPEIIEENLENLTKTQITTIGESEYVKSYDYRLQWSIESETVKAYAPAGEEIYDTINWFSLVGVEYAPVLDIEEQIFTLVEGRTFTETEIDEGTHVTLISEEVAQLNGIKIGDTITLQNNIGEFSRKNNGSKYVEVNGRVQNYAQQVSDFEVIGIMKYQGEVEGEMLAENHRRDTDMTWRKFNSIYLPNKVVEDAIEFYQQKNHEQYPEMFPLDEVGVHGYEPIYFLKSEQDLDAFSESIKSLIPENYKISSTRDSDTNYAQTLGAMRTKIMPLFYIGIGILFLIVMVGCYQYLKNRVYEYGIYIALAEKKVNIFLRTLTEICLIAMMICVPAVIVGQTLVPKIGAPLFMYQIEVAVQLSKENEADKYRRNFLYSIDDMSKDGIKEKYLEGTHSIEVVEVVTSIVIITVPAATLITIYIIKKSRKYLL